MGIAIFSTEAAAVIARIVRREMARTQNDPTRRGDNRWGDNERAIDGVCQGACAVDSLGVCIPDYPLDDEDEDGIPFWNSLADIDDGARIVILYCHRSALMAERNHGDEDELPTPWILGPATCTG